MRISILLIVLLFIPTVTASHPITPSDIALANQITDRGNDSGGMACATRGTMTANVTLLSGRDYLLIGHMLGDTWTNTYQAPNATNIFTVNRDATISSIAPDVDIVLVNWANATSTIPPNYPIDLYRLRFTPAVSGIYTVTCTSGAGVGSDMFLPSPQSGSVTGFVGGFICSTANCGNFPYLDRQFSVVLNASNNATPSPPILTGVVDGVFNQLNWTVGIGVTGGYNLTRCDLWNACTMIAFGPATFGYRDGSATTNRTYTVRGWNINGNSFESNNVTLKIGSQPLFSDNSALYGGSKSNLAAGLGVTPTALGALWGLLLVLMLAAGGYGLFRGMGAAFGAFAGTVTALAIGMWPVWLVFLLCAVAASVWVLINMRKGGE